MYVCIVWPLASRALSVAFLSVFLLTLKQPLAPGFWFWVLYMHSTCLLGTYVCMIERSCGSYLRLRGSNQLIYVLVKSKTEYCINEVGRYNNAIMVILFEKQEGPC